MGRCVALSVLFLFYLFQSVNEAAAAVGAFGDAGQGACRGHRYLTFFITSTQQGQNLKAITGIAFSADGRSVYTTSEGDAEVLEWDLKVKKKGVARTIHTHTSLKRRPLSVHNTSPETNGSPKHTHAHT